MENIVATGSFVVWGRIDNKFKYHASVFCNLFGSLKMARWIGMVWVAVMEFNHS